MPGGDVNPYLAVAAMIAAGLHGVDRELPLGSPPSTGNAYTDRGPPGAVHAARRAGVCGCKSELAREAFGNEWSSTTPTPPGWRSRRSTPRSPTGSCTAASSGCSRTGTTAPGYGHASEETGAGMSTFTVLNPATEETVATVPQARRSRPTRPSRGRPRRRPPGGRWPPATGPRCCAASPTWWTRTSRSSPSWRWPAPGHPVGQARWEAGNVRDVLRYYSAAPERLLGQQIPVPGGLERHVQGAGRHRRADRAVELPDADPGLGARRPRWPPGNPVIAKPAERTPLTAIRIGELALEAGLPEGVFQVLPGKGSVVGQRLVDHPDGPQDRLHRVHRGGQPADGRLRPPGEAGHPGAGRQERQHRVRRRRPGTGRGHRAVRGVRQRRARTAAPGPGSWSSAACSTGSWSCWSPR